LAGYFRFANLSIVEAHNVGEVGQDISDGEKLMKHKKRKRMFVPVDWLYT